MTLVQRCTTGCPRSTMDGQHDPRSDSRNPDSEPIGQSLPTAFTKRGTPIYNPRPNITDTEPVQVLCNFMRAGSLRPSTLPVCGPNTLSNAGPHCCTDGQLGKATPCLSACTRKPTGCTRRAVRVRAI